MPEAEQSDSAFDPTCVRCGYNLRGRGPEDRCSECGALVQISLNPLGPTADPRWLLSLERGSEMIALSGLLYVLGRVNYCCPGPVLLSLCGATMAVGMLFFTRPGAFANPYRGLARGATCLLVLDVPGTWLLIGSRSYVGWPESLVDLLPGTMFALVVISGSATAAYYMRRARAARARVWMIWIAGVSIASLHNALALHLMGALIQQLTMTRLRFDLPISAELMDWADVLLSLFVATTAYSYARTVRRARAQRPTNR